MKITPDDPKLTAYALGELDTAERAAVEAELEKSFVLQRAVEEIRETAKLLKENLASEELQELTFAQQRKIENQLKQSGGRPQMNWWRILFYGGVSAAAACFIVAMLLPGLSKSKSGSQQFALNSAPVSQPKKDLPPPTNTQTETPTVESIHELSVAVSPPVVIPQAATKTEQTRGVVTFNLSANTTKEPAPQSMSGKNIGSLDRSQSAVVMPVSSMPAPEQSSPAAVDNSKLFASGSGALRSSGGFGGGGGGATATLGINGANTYAGESQKSADGWYSDSRVDSTAQGENALTRAGSLGDAPIQMRFYRSVDGRQTDTATYPHLIENSFLTALDHPLSTFSIDVDTASYANVRRFLNSGQLPPPDAVRIEEMVNYFHYNYPQPRGEDPFSANIEIAGCPWNSEHRLVRIGLKGREIAQDKRPPSNFVFLIDVSGSMQPPERLPLIKEALRELVKKMTENDRVAIVVYAGAAGVKLQSTPCSQKEKILEAIDELGAGGSTAGAAGIQAAYEVAQENFIEGGVNRVLLCTDGDFNVGITDQSQLVQMIQDKAKSGVALTTLGVGTDNYKDALMQNLADKGNGNYFYLDSLEEAQKVLIDQMSGTLVTIAKDVKIQIEFNPVQVGAYRLIGYEKRMLRKEDFNNDKKDAGEIGAGHTVTALYEIVPPGEEIPNDNVDPLKYQQPADEKPERYVTTGSKELLTLKLRYKQPDGDTSKLLEFPVTDNGKSFSRASTDFKFAAAVAEFGMLLRDSEFKGDSSYGAVLELARQSKGNDAEGYRSEFINLVNRARELQQ